MAAVSHHMPAACRWHEDSPQAIGHRHIIGRKHRLRCRLDIGAVHGHRAATQIHVLHSSKSASPGRPSGGLQGLAYEPTRVLLDMLGTGAVWVHAWLAIIPKEGSSCAWERARISLQHARTAITARRDGWVVMAASLQLMVSPFQRPLSCECSAVLAQWRIILRYHCRRDG